MAPSALPTNHSANLPQTMLSAKSVSAHRLKSINSSGVTRRLPSGTRARYYPPRNARAHEAERLVAGFSVAGNTGRVVRTTASWLSTRQVASACCERATMTAESVTTGEQRLPRSVSRPTRYWDAPTWVRVV